ncbi:MAG: hypothetical protein E6G92_07570 [Alphaproteobacteria bacterium]|nr:MAG: hypothetical protein E6G92_07570 [Alphaproteobacteria bacterium]
MTAPEWVVWLTAIASFLAAMIVSTIVSVRSAARGESLFREWGKRGLYSSLAMFGVWAAYFLVFTIVAAIHG